MKIVNKTKKTTLTSDAFEAVSLLDKSLGLLNPNKPRSLILTTRFGIHTFGMKESIDILVLDKLGIVVKIGQHIDPHQIFWWNPSYSRVIELPAGTISKTQTKIGDHIFLE
jgi:uncharacterized protein